jgi:hypothetical protein
MLGDGHRSEIYLGAAVSEWSDRQALHYAYASLSAADVPFLLLANFHLGGRQVDCVAVTERRVVVVEAKASRTPVRGDIDGDWARLTFSGQWRQYTNGYQQTLRQKNLLLDAMREHGDVGSFYPDGAVVFVTGLPTGSAVTTGDFKVRICDLASFSPAGAGDRLNPWSFDDWRAFADSRSLRPVSLAEAMGGEVLESAYGLLRDYRDRVATEIDRDGSRWLAENDEQREELLAMLDHAPGFYVEGPSGCGKTLAARWLASHASRTGECVLFLAAKDFDGSWAQLLKRELGLVLEARTSDLFRAIRQTGASVRILLDGINELGPSHDVALRGLRALARRLDARVIVTGQSDVPEQLRGLAKFTIVAPTLDLKERIAREHLANMGTGMRATLKAVASGFEAAIVAEVGSDASPDASRQLLIDQYIRQRLGSLQRSGSGGLRRFAKALMEATSFSLGETAFDELMMANGLTTTEIDAMFAARLVVRRGGRVSFAHEILLNACAAFAYAKIAPEAGAKFAILLSVPALQMIATDIVAAIEDPEVVATVLRTSRDHALLSEAARGLAGPIAADAAHLLLTKTEADIEAEVAGLRLAIVEGGKPGVIWADGTVREWTDPEKARIRALAREIGTGHRIERYFELCAAMDATLLEERRRLYDEALAAGVNALKSHSFGLAYFGIGRETAFASISRLAVSGGFDIGEAPRRNTSRDMMSLTSGQLHFYLDRRRPFLDKAEVDDVAADLAGVIVERFRYEPYHVKLSILEAAGFVRYAATERVEALVEAIQSIDAERESIWVSTAIVDALKFLGALDDSAESARQGIAADFARAIGAEEDEDTRSLAMAVSTAMFDHPYDGIYSEEFEALSGEEQHLLLLRAARSENARRGAFIAWVIHQIANFEDPADAAIMQIFACLPDPRNGIPQEEWGAFVVATRFLGRHGLDLPAHDAATDAERGLVLLRALLHFLEGNADRTAIADIWAQLELLPPRVVMGTFAEVEHTLIERDWREHRGDARTSLLRPFPERWLEMSRRFLDSDEEAEHHHFAYDRDRAPNLAFQIIELHGDRRDIGRLRRLANGTRFAFRALDALRKLDAA